MIKQKVNRKAYSFLEVFAVITLLGILAVVIVPRLITKQSLANASGCHTLQGNIEIQAQIWLHNTGALPAGDLSDIGADLNYFPEGLPTCPVDGTSYTLDPATGLITGHNH